MIQLAPKGEGRGKKKLLATGQELREGRVAALLLLEEREDLDHLRRAFYFRLGCFRRKRGRKKKRVPCSEKREGEKEGDLSFG